MYAIYATFSAMSERDIYGPYIFTTEELAEFYRSCMKYKDHYAVAQVEIITKEEQIIDLLKAGVL